MAFVLPLGVVVCLALMPYFRAKGKELAAWYASALYLTLMLVAGVYALYPVILPATDPARNLTIWNSVTSDYAMSIAIRWWVFGMVLVVVYFVYVYRMFAGKVKLEDGDGHGY